MKCFMNRKWAVIIGLLFMSVVSFNGSCATFLEPANQSTANVTSVNVSNGIGRTDMTFAVSAGSRGYSSYCSVSSVQTYNFVRSFVAFKPTVVMQNQTTGETFTVPVTCPSCQASTSDGFLAVGNAINFQQTHQCPMPDGIFAASTFLQTSLFISLLDSRIPAGVYQGTITGIVGQLAEGYSGEYVNYASSMITSSVNSSVATAIAMKFDIVIPNYTICTTSSPLTINHGSLTPDQVQGNTRTQNLTIACTGPATIKLTMSNPNPQVGNGIQSHIQMSSDNINWAESSQTKLNSLGTEIINFSSTLNATGAITPQSLNGSAVVTMNYQ